VNYLTHFYFNQEIDDPLFHTGVAIPDILSGFNRRCRPDFERAQELANGDVTAAEASFYRGMCNHNDGDRIFHSSGFFKEQSSIIKTQFKRFNFPGMRLRLWFISHIALEILLDHSLLLAYPELANQFYRQFQSLTATDLSSKTLRCIKEPRSGVGLSAYIEQFTKRRFLEYYQTLEGVAEAVHRVCLRARQDGFEGPQRATLISVLRECRSQLCTPRSLIELEQWNSSG
jgi:hypothetical protein